MNETPSSDNDCPICFNQITVKNKYITDCNHEFCKDCLDKWFDKSKITCPKCRKNVQYLTYQNDKIRLVHTSSLIIARNTQNNPNIIRIKKNLLIFFMVSEILTVISIGFNIYFIYERENI